MAEQRFDNTAQQRAFRAFETLVTDGADIDLALAALLIASIEYPNLDVAHYIAQLDALARRVRFMLGLPSPEGLAQLPEGINLLTVLEAINSVLFEQEHFHGNRTDYYNPNNSFLNKVLEEHVGIPIALSLLYMEVGKRVGLVLEGIGLPFHFVVRCHLSPESVIYIDPFEQGLLLTEHDCRLRIRRMAGGKIRFQSHWFEPVTPKQFLQRMLSNLKHIYLRHDTFPLALAVCDRLLLLTPLPAIEWRDRGLIHLQLKHYGRALRDLKTYLEHVPEAEDRDEILSHIKAIRQALALLN